MIIIESAGRFGNQLFQYAGVVSFSKARERVYLVGFHELSGYFGNAVNGKIRRLSLRNFHLLSRLPRKIMGLLMFGEVLLGNDGRSLLRKRGILPVFVWRAGYCQNEELIDGTAILKLNESRPKLEMEPDKEVAQGQNRPRCFVHVRRGDYLRFPAESSPVVPLLWFRAQIVAIQRVFGSIEFLFFSDDDAWAKQHFSADPDFVFFSGTAEESFAAMVECQAGILSASTFSWWAAYLAAKTGADGPFIAPLHWMGWRSRTWYPKNIESQFLSYAPVSDGSSSDH